MITRLSLKCCMRACDVFHINRCQALEAFQIRLLSLVSGAPCANSITYNASALIMETDVQNAIDSALPFDLRAVRASGARRGVCHIAEPVPFDICVTLWLPRLFLYCESNNNNGTRTTQKATRRHAKCPKRKTKYILRLVSALAQFQTEPRFIYAHKYINFKACTWERERVLVSLSQNTKFKHTNLPGWYRLYHKQHTQGPLFWLAGNKSGQRSFHPLLYPHSHTCVLIHKRITLYLSI